MDEFKDNVRFCGCALPKSCSTCAGKKTYTYLKLKDEAEKIAASLQHIGIRKKDRIIIMLKNRIENITTFWALQMLGAVYTPINHRFSIKETEYCVNDANAKAIIFEPSSSNSVLKASFAEKPILIGIENCDGVDISFSELIERSPGKIEKPIINSDDIAIMLYTSGTTGRPKGVPRSHRSEYGSTMAHIVQNQYKIWESTLSVMPLYHTMGMRSMLSMVFLNGKSAVLPDFDSEKALNIIEKEKLTCLYLIPTLYHDIVHHEKLKQYDISSLNVISYAGAAMTTSLVNKCVKVFNPKAFVNHYGSTEVYTFSICPHVPDKPGSAGKAGIHQELRVVTADQEGRADHNDLVEIGEIGEIIVNLDTIEGFKGYWNRPDATSESIRKGWYYTGDLGYLDEEGDLFVVGRLDDMIISGGENIHPLEVEDCLSYHEGVLEAAVVGETDSRWGQVVSAYIVPKEPAVTAVDLDEFCKGYAKLANFKRPRKYTFVKEIPKSASGKILRRKLRDGEFEVIKDQSELIN